MSSFRISVTQGGQRKRVETSLEDFTFFGLIVQDLFIKKTSGQLDLQGPVRIGAPVSPTDAVQLLQVTQLESVVNDALLGLTELEDAIAATNLLIELQAGEIDELRCRLEYLEANEPIEENLTSGVGGQTVFTFSTITFNIADAIPDVQVWIETDKQRPDQAGGTTEAYRKLAVNQIEFSEIIPEGVTITGRLEGDHFTNPKPENPFFRHYVEGITTNIIPIPEDFDLLTGKLGSYRNGLYMAESPLVGPIAQRYAESSRDTISVAPGYEPDVDTFFTFYHLDPVKDLAPVYKIFVTGLSGTVITLPAYTVGTDRLRVLRNGLMGNTASKGALSLQYAETSGTSITLAQAATIDEYWVFEYAATAPEWRDDLDGITGVDVDFTIPNVYTIGDKRLQIWKNGVLAVDSITQWIVSQQYIENGTNCIQFQVAIGPDDVITAIYLPT